MTITIIMLIIITIIIVITIIFGSAGLLLRLAAGPGRRRNSTIIQYINPYVKYGIIQYINSNSTIIQYFKRNSTIIIQYINPYVRRIGC